jgi:hypothetical protein
MLTGKVTSPARAADKTRLTTLLKYHIIDKEYITQVDPLKTIRTNYFSQTLNEGDNGKILFQHDPLCWILANPTIVFSLTAARRGTSVRTHNLRYDNGIAM